MILVTSMLWKVDKAGWLLLVLLSGLNLILDLFSTMGGTALSALLPGIVVNAVILLYCLWPRTRQAFVVRRGLKVSPRTTQTDTNAFERGEAASAPSGGIRVRLELGRALRAHSESGL